MSDKDNTLCQKDLEPFHMCCCGCSMHVPLVHDYFDRKKVVRWTCIGFLIASKGKPMNDENDVFIEECGEHGMCELHQDSDRDPLENFFRREK